MTDEQPDRLAGLARRYERERKARREAEAIAERVTAQLYATGRDIEQKNEELRAVNQAMRDFVAVASHDLRSPLTAILASASTIVERSDLLDLEHIIEFAKIIERQSLHLNRIIEDLLTVSKIDAGALETRPQPIALGNAVREAVGDLTLITSDVHVEVTDSTLVLVDPDHLRRIVENFVGNALKYGAPPVEVDARDENGSVELRVRDRGDGVPPEFVPRLFGRFARADSARTKQGTGLGLSIVKGLAQVNGGDTWYEPNEPHGSCFALRLPKPA